MNAIIEAVPMPTLITSCKQQILGDLFGGSVLGMGVLRASCKSLANDYSVEVFNAALNDLLREKRIAMHGLNSFVVSENG